MRITNEIALGVGTAGALEDVTAYVDLAAGITYNWGRQSGFEDTRPGEITFTLDNGDGRFTPDHPTSPLATTLVEGAAMCWKSGDRLVTGRVRSIKPAFPGDESAWAQITVTCDDALGDLARTAVDDLPLALVEGAEGLLYWPADDSATSAQLSESFDRFPMTPTTETGSPFTYEFGSEWAGGRQLTMTAAAAAEWTFTANRTVTTPYTYPSGSIGSWGFWFTPTTATPYLTFWGRSSVDIGARIQINDLTSVNFGVRIGTSTYAHTFTVGVPCFIAVELTGGTGTSVIGKLYIDGQLIGTKTDAFATVLTDSTKTPKTVTVGVGDEFSATSAGFNISRISHTLTRINEYPLVTHATPSARLAALEPLSETPFDTIPDLGIELIGLTAGESALDYLNNIVRTVQGQMYVTTTGTLTNPSSVITFTGADRPSTVSYEFNAETDLDGAPDLIRDTTDMVSAVTVDGPEGSEIVTAAALTKAQLRAKVGTSNTSESVEWVKPTQLVHWGEDRINRGITSSVRTESFTVDGMTTSTDRTDDLLALTPGIRVQLTGLPTTQLGFTTADGWVLGAEEAHTLTGHDFTIYLEQTLPDTGIFNTDRFASGGELTLAAGINNTTTTVTVATTGMRFTTNPADFPVDIEIGTEQMTVTGCTSATPQVMTVTRGVNGTTATSHSTGAAVDLAVITLFAF